MATLQNIGKLKYRGKDGQWHPLPVVVQDASGGVSTISGKGAPTSATQGKVNQLYRDESTDKLYICTGDDGGYTWAAVSGGSVDVDATLTKAGYAADAKAAGDAIEKKLDTTALPTAINDALAQAKASGAFDGEKGEPGADGKDGKPGIDGKDGITPHVGENGNWYIGDTDTGVRAQGNKGEPGADGHPGADGQSGTDGQDGVTPHIGENGNWWIGTTDTGVSATGSSDKSLGITSAMIGQIVRIDAVDANGKPTAWEAVDETNRMEWKKICDIVIGEDDDNVAALSTSTMTDGTPLSELNIQEIIFAGYTQIAEASSYPYCTFFVNDRSVIIGQNFNTFIDKKVFFRGRFGIIGDGYATAEWCTGDSATQWIAGGGIVVEPHYYGANKPEIEDKYNFTKITSIKLTGPKSNSGIKNDIKFARLLVYGR